LDFPAQNTPVIGHEEAGGGTAGLAQLGIVVFELGGVEVNALGTVFGAGWLRMGNFPCTVCGLSLIRGVGWHAGLGHT